MGQETNDIDETINEYRSKHHRCRFCRYLIPKRTRCYSPYCKSYTDVVDGWKCKLKNKLIYYCDDVADGIFPRGILCWHYEPYLVGGDNEI